MAAADPLHPAAPLQVEGGRHLRGAPARDALGASGRGRREGGQGQR